MAETSDEALERSHGRRDDDGARLAELAAELEQLIARAERVAVQPERIPRGWFGLARPLLRWFGYEATFEVARTRLLLDLFGAPESKDDSTDDVLVALQASIEEQEQNIRRAERACVVHGQLPTSHVAWLQRLLIVLQRILATLEQGLASSSARIAAAFDSAMLAPPLALDEADKDASKGKKATAPSNPAERTTSQLIGLQLAAIDHIIEAARSETSFLQRRRALLEAARRLLLDADASLPLQQAGVRERKRYLAEEIVRIDRLQACGLSPGVALLHQARSALSRGDRQRLHAALIAMDTFALGAGDAKLSADTSTALGQLIGEAEAGSEEALAASLERSTTEMFGTQVRQAVCEAHEGAREAVEDVLDRPNADQETYQLALEFLAPGSDRATMSALLGSDGCFDVGAPLCPVRFVETEQSWRVVTHPTEDLALKRARRAEDLAQAVIDDPRALILQLATGRLLTRKYIKSEPRKRQRTKLVGEVRVYLLDGSTSMMSDGVGGARARMRDAILVAELASLMQRFQSPDKYVRVALYYRYFTKRMWPIGRVDSAAAALAAIGDVIGTVRHGGTDIERALCDCFETIREAKESDPILARAQVVLVTDGNARVGERLVQAAREETGQIPIDVSVIALGEENETLRKLVARQRANGDRCFYHFIDDSTLAALCSGRLDDGRSLHLPAGAPPDSETLRGELTELLDGLASLDIDRHRALLSSRDEELASAYAELGLPPPTQSEGARALREANQRERRALQKRYGRWFPKPGAAPEQAPEPSEKDNDIAIVLLSTVAEVVGEMGGSELSRMADAIDIIERLLPDAGLSPARYQELVMESSTDVVLRESLRAVHRAARQAPRPIHTAEQTNP